VNKEKWWKNKFHFSAQKRRTIAYLQERSIMVSIKKNAGSGGEA